MAAPRVKEAKTAEVLSSDECKYTFDLDIHELIYVFD